MANRPEQKKCQQLHKNNTKMTKYKNNWRTTHLQIDK